MCHYWLLVLQLNLLFLVLKYVQNFIKTSKTSSGCTDVCMYTMYTSTIPHPRQKSCYVTNVHFKTRLPPSYIAPKCGPVSRSEKVYCSLFTMLVHCQCPLTSRPPVFVFFVVAHLQQSCQPQPY